MSSDDHDDESHPDFLGQKYDEFNSKIMVTAVVSLTFVIFLVVGLHIYVRYALRRQARRRAPINQLGLTVAHARASEPPTKTGLDPAILVALPSFVFKPQQFGQAHEDRKGTAMECPVCLSNLEVGEMARLLPNCKHVFHLQCIDKWLIANPTCPICRTEAEPQIKPEPREGPETGLVCGDNRSTPSAPVLDDHMSTSMVMVEGASDGAPEVSDKMNRSNSRLSSFRRMLSRERSLRRIQPHSQDVTMEDLERQ